MPGSLYRYILMASGRGQVILSFLSLALIPLATLPLEFQRRIVNEALASDGVRLLLQLAAAYLGVLALQAALKFTLGLYRGHVTESVIRNLRDMVYRCSFMTQSAASAPADPPEKGTIISMVAAEVETLGGFVGEGISFPLLQIGTIMAVAGYMIWVQPVVAAVSLALLVPQIVVVPLVQQAINRRSEARAQRIREIGEFVVERGAIAPADAPTPSPYLELLDRVYRLRLKIYLLKGILKVFNTLLSRVSTLGVLVVGGWMVIEGNTELGTIVAFVSALERIGQPWRELVGFYRRVSDARVKYSLLVNTFPPMPADMRLAFAAPKY